MRIADEDLGRAGIARAAIAANASAVMNSRARPYSNPVGPS